jgi:beta-glucosidase
MSEPARQPLRYDGIRWAAEPVVEEEQALNEAVKLASRSDIALVVCGLHQDWESQGHDRPSLTVPLRTDDLVHRIAQANPNTVVNIQGGSAIALP